MPDQALEGKKCPTLYLLHGYGGNSLTWLGIKPELPQMADRDGIIVVCPDGKTAGTGTALPMPTANMKHSFPLNW